MLFVRGHMALTLLLYLVKKLKTKKGWELSFMHPAQFSDLPFSRLMAYFSSFMVYQIHRVLDQLRPNNSYSMINWASGHLIIGVKGNNLLLIMTYIPTNHYIIYDAHLPHSLHLKWTIDSKLSFLLFCICSSHINIVDVLPISCGFWQFLLILDISTNHVAG